MLSNGARVAWAFQVLGKAMMTVAGEDLVPQKLADFYRDPHYENRVVVFYDILGWRTEIKEAGNDPRKIGDLRRLLLYHTRILSLPVAAPVNISTFSDNVVISTPVHTENVPYFLRSLAVLQLMTVSLGFLLRGGVVVGKILHDDEVVFGPALIRAWQLESQVAVVPRIVLDEAVVSVGEIAGFHCFEDGLYFLDPFTTEFVQFWLDNSSDRHSPNLTFRDAGLPASGRLPVRVPGDLGLKSLLDVLRKRVRSPLPDKEWNKVAWLYDRIAARVGMPPAKSYPRVRPK